ncbi:aromatic ring-hydroxylating oxygenase subunit alpha [Sphingomonas jatrophae]|uniref:Phenylpropionate dioxygenase, large terminal subunit n=1 Tax=Sphingomonas jatrophae TaxID=1166337 RepID=A0A1I6M427_9SPHN|nr:aromatic ring-hydroxylating dioxygenase subunit alpha [Sphingomonas jatrophae]SFS10431.1 Phenylpropionate dioxygenase, large terminal subunit [Sphingomonas jatrophae]
MGKIDIQPHAGRPIGVDLSKAPEPTLSNKPITPERYWDRDFWKREWETVWTRTWQVAAMVNQFTKPGDFVTLEFGSEVILAVMGEDREIRCFYNVCQHRGMMLVTQEVGNSRRLTCPYHAWSYNLAGEIKTIPDEPDFPASANCRSKNLVPIKTGIWGGFVWFNMDDDAEPLRDFLAPVADHLDAYPMDQMVRTHWVTIEGDFNWKLVQDNFNESYHVFHAHPQLKYVAEFSYLHSQFDLYPSGHARMLMAGGAPSRTLRGGEPEIIRQMGEHIRFWGLDPEDFRGRMHDLREALQQQKRKLGAEKGYDFSSYDDTMLTDNWHYTLFPNLSFSMKPDGNIWLRARPHPTDPEKCFFDMWYLNLFPEGQTSYYSPTMRDWVSMETPAPHQSGKAGDYTMGPTIDQDVALWSAQQKALHSRGYKREVLAGQESRVRYFHDNLERWMARG